MNSRLRRLLSLPLILAATFFVLPVLLFNLYPNSLWTGTDYEPLALADALNMAYRIADHQLYPAKGLIGHPGVPFYFMSWLALAFIGYPVASQSPGFFNTVIGHVDEFHQVAVWLGALAGASGVFIFALVARNLVPAGVIIIGLLAWLVSTPATLLMFTSTSIDSFAILINALFFLALAQSANRPEITPGMVVLSACVGAFAYLNKLSYIYVPLSLAGTGILNFALRKYGWARASRLSVLFALSFLLGIAAVGYFIIGWDGFHSLREFHKSVLLGSGRYGTGEQIVVSASEIWRAIAAIQREKAFAVFIALAGGTVLAVAGLVTALRGPRDFRAAIIGIGTGSASALSAIFVLKHYSLHYTAGVSATLPAAVVGGFLLAKSWGYTIRAGGAVLSTIAILMMSHQMLGWLVPELAAQTNRSQQAKADLEDIHIRTAGIKQAVEFAYRAPFAEYGKGMVVVYGSVPRLTEDYLQSRDNAISSITTEAANREVGAYLIDKVYFPTVESVKAASNVTLLGPKPVAYKDGDELIELRTVFLLIPRR